MRRREWMFIRCCLFCLILALVNIFANQILRQKDLDKLGKFSRSEILRAIEFLVEKIKIDFDYYGNFVPMEEFHQRARDIQAMAKATSTCGITEIKCTANLQETVKVSILKHLKALQNTENYMLDVNWQDSDSNIVQIGDNTISILAATEVLKNYPGAVPAQKLNALADFYRTKIISSKGGGEGNSPTIIFPCAYNAKTGETLNNEDCLTLWHNSRSLAISAFIQLHRATKNVLFKDYVIAGAQSYINSPTVDTDVLHDSWFPLLVGQLLPYFHTEDQHVSRFEDLSLKVVDKILSSAKSTQDLGQISRYLISLIEISKIIPKSKWRDYGDTLSFGINSILEATENQKAAEKYSNDENSFRQLDKANMLIALLEYAEKYVVVK